MKLTIQNVIAPIGVLIALISALIAWRAHQYSQRVADAQGVFHQAELLRGIGDMEITGRREYVFFFIPSECPDQILGALPLSLYNPTSSTISESKLVIQIPSQDGVRFLLGNEANEYYENTAPHLATYARSHHVNSAFEIVVYDVDQLLPGAIVNFDEVMILPERSRIEVETETADGVLINTPIEFEYSITYSIQLVHSEIGVISSEIDVLGIRAANQEEFQREVFDRLRDKPATDLVERVRWLGLFSSSQPGGFAKLVYGDPSTCTGDSSLLQAASVQRVSFIAN